MPGTDSSYEQFVVNVTFLDMHKVAVMHYVCKSFSYLLDMWQSKAGAITQ